MALLFECVCVLSKLVSSLVKIECMAEKEEEEEVEKNQHGRKLKKQRPRKYNF